MEYDFNAKQEVFVPIADFAEMVGVSKQAVYKRIDKDLSSYCKTVDGTRRISLSARPLFNRPLQEANTNDEVKKDFLVYQLQEKDRIIKEQQETIKELTAEIRELHKHIMTQSATTTEILQKQSQLQENFQILLGQQQTAAKLESTAEQPVEQPVVSTAGKGFFKRLFK